jgi:serine/threonine-protein kinase
MLAADRELADSTSALCPACHLLAAEQPQPVAGYQVVRRLGQGGMGVVYLALRSQGQPCALKVMLTRAAASPAQVGRFLREAGILRELDHPNIVAFRDLGECAGQLYLVMDYVAGQDLGTMLKAHGPFPVPRAARWACQLLEALEYAHARRFVHRDIKPANVMIAEPGGADAVRLVDFGLARVYQASQVSGLTATGDMGGTPAYTAPEQVLRFREAQPASDLYAVAATLYHLLTNRHVYDFTGEPAERFLKVLNEDPVPIRQRRPDLPENLAGVIHRCLAREPAQRFPDAAAFRAALLPFRRESAAGPPLTGPRPPAAAGPS